MVRTSGFGDVGPQYNKIYGKERIMHTELRSRSRRHEIELAMKFHSDATKKIDGGWSEDRIEVLSYHHTFRFLVFFCLVSNVFKG